MNCLKIEDKFKHIRQTHFDLTNIFLANPSFMKCYEAADSLSHTHFTFVSKRDCYAICDQTGSGEAISKLTMTSLLIYMPTKMTQ